MLWPLNPSGITSFNCTQAILGRLSTLRNTLDDDVRFLDRGCPTRLSTVSLESSEANVVDSKSTDSSDDVVSQSSMMTSCWTSVLHIQPLKLQAIDDAIRWHTSDLQHASFDVRR